MLRYSSLFGRKRDEMDIWDIFALIVRMVTNPTFLTFFFMGVFTTIGFVAAILAIRDGNRQADRMNR
jgi:hypothetical protein